MTFLIIENLALIVILLAFVPLRKIANAQDWVKNKIKQIKDKLDN